MPRLAMLQLIFLTFNLTVPMAGEGDCVRVWETRVLDILFFVLLCDLIVVAVEM